MGTTVGCASWRASCATPDARSSTPGLRQSPESIAAMTAQEDVDVVGVSMHNGAHLTLAPAVVGALRAAGLETPVVIGGIVPPADVDVLMADGVAAVLGPGASNDEVVATVRTAAGPALN